MRFIIQATATTQHSIDDRVEHRAPCQIPPQLSGLASHLKRLLLRAGRPGVRQAKSLEDGGGLLGTQIAICQVNLNGDLLLREPLPAEVIDKLVRV